uniref:Uncharacterized protein n=1 Tax=Arundo donax TaxID=35708 RepID=A0A0A9EA42_ARUDO
MYEDPKTKLKGRTLREGVEGPFAKDRGRVSEKEPLRFGLQGERYIVIEWRSTTMTRKKLRIHPHLSYLYALGYYSSAVF